MSSKWPRAFFMTSMGPALNISYGWMWMWQSVMSISIWYLLLGIWPVPHVLRQALTLSTQHLILARHHGSLRIHFYHLAPVFGRQRRCGQGLGGFRCEFADHGGDMLVDLFARQRMFSRR